MRDRATETVLLVEDEDVVRRLVTQVLEDEGFEILVANNGDEALEIAGRRHVDLLVTDVMMPGSAAARCRSGCGSCAPT